MTSARGSLEEVDTVLKPAAVYGLGLFVKVQAVGFGSRMGNRLEQTGGWQIDPL